MHSLEESTAIPIHSVTGSQLWQPIIYSTLSMSGIKDLVSRSYELDDLLECTFISRSVSDTYKLSTSKRRYALKVYRTNWRTRADLIWEMSALEQIERQGVDVVKPILRKDGSSITEVHAPEGSRSAVLFEWANGAPPKYTYAHHARQYGRLLAKLHDAGAGIPMKCFRPVMDRVYLLDDPLARIRTRLVDRPDILSKLAALEARLSARLAEVERRSLDWGFCHGDVWINNARFDGNRLVLFDFDFAAPGWRIFDLASYRWDARRRDVEHRAWDPFIEGYLEIRPAVEASLGFVDLFMILKHLWTTAFFIERSPETGTNFLSDEELEEMVPICERIGMDMGVGGDNGSGQSSDGVRSAAVEAAPAP